MPIEASASGINVIGNGVRCIRFYDDDRTLRAEIYLDDNNRLNIAGLTLPDMATAFNLVAMDKDGFLLGALDAFGQTTRSPGVAIGDAASGNYLKYSTTNGFRISAGTSAVIIDDNGITIEQGAGSANEIAWKAAGTLITELRTRVASNDDIVDVLVGGRDSTQNGVINLLTTTAAGNKNTRLYLGGPNNIVDLSADTVYISGVLRFGGGQSSKIRTVSADTTLTTGDGTVLVDTSGGTKTITLPPAADAYNGDVDAGQILVVVNISTNAVTVDGNGSETINGATTKALAAQWDKVVVQSDGSNWVIIGG